jgi:hypothetical protein
MQPAGEVAYRGIDAHDGSLRQPILLKMGLERLGYRDEPLTRLIMAEQFLVEGKKPLQVTPFGIESGFHLLSHFRLYI